MLSPEELNNVRKQFADTAVAGVEVARTGGHEAIALAKALAQLAELGLLLCAAYERDVPRPTNSPTP
jgi:hypothetical protein